MKKLQLILFLLITNFLFSQIVFEPGFYIDKTGSRHEGLIKNYQWKNNPEEIEFKENEKSAVKKVSENEISEFSVGDEKYIGAKVLVDHSSSNISNLSTDKDFNLKEEFILLKLIVFGDAELYQSFDGGGNKFFYKKKDDAQLQYLKFKEYLVKNSAIKKNEEYKIQLKNLFADNQSITQNEIDRLPYRYREMRQIFEKYNNISKTIEKRNGNNFNIYIKPGVGFSKYSVSSDEYDITGGDYKKSGISLRLGLELEYVLNFNKRKWAIISELAFQKTEIKIPDYNRRVFEGKYTSIQVPLGIKHSMFINPYFKIFVTASMNADILLDSKVFYIDNIPQEKRSAVISPIYSLGTNYKNFGFEAKLGANPSFFSSYYGQFNSIGLGNIAFALSYKIK